jgi:hypothetical protein
VGKDVTEPAFDIKVNNSIPVLELASLSIGDAHEELGRSVSAQIHRILESRFKGKTPEWISASQSMVRSQLARIENHSREPSLPSYLKESLRIYLDCLWHWSRGAGLLNADYRGWTDFELAMLLQDDHPGCQSGVYRQPLGSVLFWHTEEDVDETDLRRVDQPRLMRFRSPFGSTEITSFIYPDLLPGPNFNWRSDGLLQFADSLLLQPECRREGVPANLIAWLSLLLEGEIRAAQIIEFLQPIFDGYALFRLYPQLEGIACTRVEFALDQFQETRLSLEPGVFLAQTNAFSAQSGSLAKRFERTPFPSRRHFEARVRRAEKALGVSPDLVDPTRIQKMLASQEGNRWAFANGDVKAHLFGRLSADSLEINCHPGMAVKPG